jgi:hypothetical protein
MNITEELYDEALMVVSWIKKEKPKTICECGAKLKIGVKEWNLKQHRETSSQHLAWLAKSCITNNEDVPL